MQYTRYKYDDFGIQTNRIDYSGDKKTEQRTEILRDEYDNIIGEIRTFIIDGVKQSVHEKKYNYVQINNSFYNTYFEKLTDGKLEESTYRVYEKDEGGELIPQLQNSIYENNVSKTKTTETYEAENLVRQESEYLNDNNILELCIAEYDKPDEWFTTYRVYVTEKESGKFVHSEYYRKADDFKEREHEHYLGYRKTTSEDGEEELFYEITIEEEKKNDCLIVDSTTKFLDSENNWNELLNRQVIFLRGNSIEYQYKNGDLMSEYEKDHEDRMIRVKRRGVFNATTNSWDETKWYCSEFKYVDDIRNTGSGLLKEKIEYELDSDENMNILIKVTNIYDNNGGLLMVTKEGEFIPGGIQHEIYVRDGRVERIFTENKMVVNEYNDDNNVVFSMCDVEFPKELFDYYYNRMVEYICKLEEDENVTLL